MRFSTPDDLRAKVIHALYRWLDKHSEYRPSAVSAPNVRPYLEWLTEQTATIDVRGLGVGSGKAHNFPIQDLYIPLTALGRAEGGVGAEDTRQIGLEEALSDNRLIIIGDPGSGKTTFLRRITFALAGLALESTSLIGTTKVGDLLIEKLINANRQAKLLAKQQQRHEDMPRR